MSRALTLAEDERARMVDAEDVWLRSLRWCSCDRRSIPDRTYLGHRSCRRCGLLMRVRR
jgi:hypothetical protein